ncbi:hypothetical protein AWT69_001058 [Pseudomonas putida]|nr:hypothetical protein AWT69_001058 [Pseudomonas putida]
MNGHGLPRAGHPLSMACCGEAAGRRSDRLTSRPGFPSVAALCFWMPP